MGRQRSAIGGGGRIGVALAVLALLLAPAAPAQDDPVFTTDVNLVNLLVTVKNPQGAPVGGLAREDFTVIDGSEQKIVVFERRTDRPLSVALLIDASLSTAIELEYERESAKVFAANLLGEGSHADDRMTVMQFSEGVELLSGFTASIKRLERSIDRVKPDTGTSLYDAILLASEELEAREGRRVIIVITDGGDTTSYSAFSDAMQAAHEADAVIFGLVVLPIKADAGRNIGGENALKVLAENTGGATYVESGQAGLDRAFREIIENLRTQYLLAYYPPEHDDPKSRYRRVEVRVANPAYRVLARNGYYVPEPPRYLPESVPTRIEPQDEQRQRGWRKAKEAPQ